MAPLCVPCFRCSALIHANVGCLCCFSLMVLCGTEAAENARKQRSGFCQLLAGWRKHSEVCIRFKLDPRSVQNAYFTGEKTKEQGNDTETLVKNINMFFYVKWSPVIRRLQQFLHQCVFFYVWTCFNKITNPSMFMKNLNTFPR